ncbi:MAG: NADH-quinone oxidoreductase subunit G [Egibacteraceae bacterium]
MSEDQVTLSVDGQELTVPKGTLVIRACEELGITVPRFCDHPLLDPVAACRQCLVEVEGQRKPMTACSTTCTPDMVVKTHLTSELAKHGQEGQLELLLINHPLDCPMCDKGGECPLQDQALAHGPGHSRMVDQKRRFDKPVPISPQIGLDRERCVLCARCTRFSDEISGDPFIELFERGALEQVAIDPEQPYHSYFSGNVVQICPVGALTATSYRFRARPFDLRSVDGICNQCSAGCNLRVDVRHGQIERQLASENMATNEMWSCDKGRFGFTAVAAPERFDAPQARTALGGVEPTGWRHALKAAADGLRAALDEGGGQAVGVLTGGRLTDEDSYAVGRFARDVLGTDNVDFRLRPSTGEERDVLAAVAGTTGPTYDDVERAQVVIVAGLDTEEEVPILHLRLRKAWRKRRQRIVFVGPVLGSLAPIAWRWIRTEAGGEAQVLRALAGDPDAPEQPDELDEVADALQDAERAVVLAGERLAESAGALEAAAAIAVHGIAGDTPAFAWVPRRNGARGAVDAGLLPGLLPGGRRLEDPGPVTQAWNRLPETEGLDARGMLEAAAAGDLKALYLIGVDPVSDFSDPRLAEAALERVDFVIAQDLLPTASTRFADVILPACAAQERVGSFTTWEGRRQPFPQAVPPPGLALQDWDIVRQLASALDVDLGWETAGDVRREAAPLMDAGVSATERLAAIELRPVEPPPPSDEEFPFAAVQLDWLLAERSTMLAGAKELLATARPATVWLNPDDAAAHEVADGAAVTVTGPGGEMELPVKVTSAVHAGTLVLPANAGEQSPGRLADEDAGGDLLRVKLAATADGDGDGGGDGGDGGDDDDVEES